MSKNYLIIAFYHFINLEDPQAEIALQKDFLHQRDVTSRIYISEAGINAQMCAAEQDGVAYIEWMKSRKLFQDVSFKIDSYHEHVFPRLTVKYRKHLVAYDEEVDLSKRGEHLSPEAWKQMLEKEQEYILIDVRNEYEWRLGRFKGAELPPCETFRDFKKYSTELTEKVDPAKTPVMMYCTGGIRCELYSSILKEKGFEKVFQLEGGIINYGQKQGSDHWLGKLFVFDDRLSVPISQEESPVIGTCYHCGTQNDTYYNCANMDCNHLFLCCKECLEKWLGCCKEVCKEAPRLRPYHHQNPHKPFRKWHHYFTEKGKGNQGS